MNEVLEQWTEILLFFANFLDDVEILTTHYSH